MAQFSFLDDYSRRARLVPALLVVLPAAVAALCWLPTASVKAIAVGLFSWFGFGLLLAELGRDLGKRRESALWATWGGSPTVRRLRLLETATNDAARDRWRRLVSGLASDVRFPSREDEQADPKAADDTYAVCIARIRELTRDSVKFPLVYQENVSYGFRRNLWAMKPAAIALAALALFVTPASLVVSTNASIGMVCGSAAISVVMLTWWCLRITSRWVREAAERYAEQLLWSCEQLATAVAKRTLIGF